MYIGKLSPSKHQYLELLEIIKIANKFALKKLVEALLRTISEELTCLLEKHIISTMITAENERFDALERRCLAIIEESPEAVLLSKDFRKCNKNLLVAQLKKDRLDMGEAEIWDCVLNWTIAQASVSSDSKNWNAYDIATLKKIIVEIIPHLRLFYMKQTDFVEREPIMEQLLPESLHKVLKRFYLSNGHNQNITLPNEATSTNTIRPPVSENWVVFFAVIFCHSIVPRPSGGFYEARAGIFGTGERSKDARKGTGF